MRVRVALSAGETSTDVSSRPSALTRRRLPIGASSPTATPLRVTVNRSPRSSARMTGATRYALR